MKYKPDENPPALQIAMRPKLKKRISSLAFCNNIHYERYVIR